MNGITISNANEMPVVFYKFSVFGKASKTNVKEMSRQAELDNHAEKGTVTSLVTRIPTCYAKPIKTIEGKIRNLFYTEAIALGDSYGVPIAVLPAFKAKLSKLEQEYALYFSKLVEAAHSGELARVLAIQSGELIEKIKVPTIDEIEQGYGVSVDVSVNFNSSAVEAAMKVLSDDIKNQLRKEVAESADRTNKARLEAVTRTIVETVKEFIDDVRTRCSKGDVKGTQFKTLVDRVEHIIKVLPAYNVTNNPELAKLIDAVKNSFETVNKDSLKDDDKARSEAVNKANEIAKSFATLF